MKALFQCLCASLGLDIVLRLSCFPGMAGDTERLGIVLTSFVSLYLRKANQNLALKHYGDRIYIVVDLKTQDLWEGFCEEPQGPPPHHHLSV